MDTEIDDWMFINQLGWLEPVKDYLVENIELGSPDYAGGISLDADLPVPSLNLGIVGVSGLQIGLGVDLPDSGASSVDFAMSSRQDPFTITVFGVGGSGSFALEVDATRIVLIEGSLAVTYELAVNVFIAAASLSVSLGAFVEYEADEDGKEEVTLGAYAVVEGSASFIGLVKITGAVTVALIYRVNRKRLRGVAAVTGEVSSPFGKSSATHDVEIEIALGDDAFGQRRLPSAAATGGKDDAASAAFGDRYTRAEWTTYCNAFAA